MRKTALLVIVVLNVAEVLSCFGRMNKAVNDAHARHKGAKTTSSRAPLMRPIKDCLPTIVIVLANGTIQPCGTTCEKGVLRNIRRVGDRLFPCLDAKELFADSHAGSRKPLRLSKGLTPGEPPVRTIQKQTTMDKVSGSPDSTTQEEEEGETGTDKGSSKQQLQELETDSDPFFPNKAAGDDYIGRLKQLKSKKDIVEFIRNERMLEAAKEAALKDETLKSKLELAEMKDALKKEREKQEDDDFNEFSTAEMLDMVEHAMSVAKVESADAVRRAGSTSKAADKGEEQIDTPTDKKKRKKQQQQAGHNNSGKVQQSLVQEPLKEQSKDPSSDVKELTEEPAEAKEPESKTSRDILDSPLDSTVEKGEEQTSYVPQSKDHEGSSGSGEKLEEAKKTSSDGSKSGSQAGKVSMIRAEEEEDGEDSTVTMANAAETSD